jgi:streptomycin 6-kinase
LGISTGLPKPAFPQRWKVGDPVLIAETVTSRIWKVSLDDGRPAVVKDLKPVGIEDERSSADFLKYRRGEGAIRLFGRDRHRMLLEYAGGRHLVDDLNRHGDRAAMELAAEVLARLLSPSQHPYPPGLEPLAVRFRSLFRKAGADRAAGVDSLYVEAAEIAERLLANPRDVRALHGDLHHENIMHGPRGWLAIDPKGLVGDPGYDAANLFYNPLDRDDLCLDPERIAFMAEIFARTLGQDVRAILDHAIAYGCLSASWHDEDGNMVDANRELSVAAVIREVRASQ